MAPINQRYSSAAWIVPLVAFGLGVVFLHNQPTHKLKRAAPGRYELSSTIQTNYLPDRVKAILYIPKNQLNKPKFPLIVYYHSGNPSPEAYRQVGQLVEWAEEKS